LQNYWKLNRELNENEKYGVLASEMAETRILEAESAFGKTNNRWFSPTGDN
jgi:hypothetical protein